MPWFKAKSDIIKKFAFFVFLWIEEEAEVVKNIIKEVMDNDTSLYRAWQSIDEVIVFLNL